MATTVLFVIACIFFACAAHPFSSYPLSLLAINARRRGAPKGAAASARNLGPVRFAICTSAYNEEKVIGAKLRNLLEVKAASPYPVELLLYIDAASDSTAQIAAQFSEQVTVINGATRHGKTHGMNRLVERTQADLIVFTDANVMLDPNLLDHLAPYFDDGRVGCVCGNLNYVNARDSVTASTGSLYWRLEEFVKREESKLGSVMGADGSLFAMRRSLHQPPPDHLIDDMYVSLHVLCSGYRVVQASDVKAYEDSVSVAAEEFNRKVRIACQAFNVHRVIWPALARCGLVTRYMYVSHKLMRWFSIYFLVASALCFAAGLVAAGQGSLALFLAVLCGFALYVGARFRVTPLTQLVDVLSALLGAGLGIWNSLRGQVYQTWKPAASVRK
jgi:cellulose synthase/poly-beta-1,6-N-acetylglucosamine synthase-like glycosyltransferase